MKIADLKEQKVLIDILKTYSLTIGNAAFYSGYSKNYFYQCTGGWRKTTREVIKRLLQGMLRSYNIIYEVDDTITQQEFSALLKKHNILPKHLCNMLPLICKNTINNQMYKMRKGILTEDVFFDMASQITNTVNIYIQEIVKDYESYLSY